MKGASRKPSKTWSVVLSTKDDNRKWRQEWVSPGETPKKRAEKVQMRLYRRLGY